MWGKLPAMAQEHLDAAAFKPTFLLDEGFALAKKHLSTNKEPEESPQKRPKKDVPEAVLPGARPADLPGSVDFQTIAEILQNGRSANCLRVFVLVAEGVVVARKTKRGKPSCMYSILVSDGATEAVVTAWGEGAKTLQEGARGREGQCVAITQVGSSDRNARVGIPELMAGRGMTVQAVLSQEESAPAPCLTSLQQLPEVSDWAAVNIEGRVLEVLVGGHFKLVDDSGLAIRVHVDKVPQPNLQEGQLVQVLLGTKSNRYGNVSAGTFSAVRGGEVLAPEQVPPVSWPCELAGAYASEGTWRWPVMT